VSERPAIGDHEAVFTIAVAARLTGMHPQTLRKYERGGLLRPARLAGNHRLYSAADVLRLRRIQVLVNRGLNLAGLELALAMADVLDAVAPDATRAEMRRAIDRATRLSRAERPSGAETPASR